MIPQLGAGVRICLAEFFGTALLVMAVSYNATGGDANWNPLAIGFTLMVAIYSMARVSGGKFNPAVSASLVMAGKLDVATAAMETIAQIIGAVAARAMHKAFAAEGTVLALGPGSDYTKGNVVVVETVYTMLLVMTVLLAAVAEAHEGKQWYGFAIGSTVVVGATAVGGISGGAFNPAVAIGIDVHSGNFGQFWYYALAHYIAAALAALIYRQVRPEEYGNESTDMAKYICEFLGTFYLCATVGFSVISGASGAGLAIGLVLAVNVCNMGSISGAHFNPCVTIACALSGRGACPWKVVPFYWAAQALGAIVAMYVYTDVTQQGFLLALDQETGAPTKMAACMSEGWYTAQLVFVILSSTTLMSTADWAADYVGLVIGGTLVSCAFSAGTVSGGVVNPAVGLSIAMGGASKAGGGMMGYAMYCLGQIVGVFAALYIFALIFCDEYGTDAAAKVAEMKEEEGDMAKEMIAWASNGSSESAESDKEV